MGGEASLLQHPMPLSPSKVHHFPYSTTGGSSEAAPFRVSENKESFAVRRAHVVPALSSTTPSENSTLRFSNPKRYEAGTSLVELVHVVLGLFEQHFAHFGKVVRQRLEALLVAALQLQVLLQLLCAHQSGASAQGTRATQTTEMRVSVDALQPLEVNSVFT